MSESPNECTQKGLEPCLYADRYVRTFSGFYFPTLKSGDESIIMFHCFPEKTRTDTSMGAFWMAFRSRHHFSHFGAPPLPHKKMAASSSARCPLQRLCVSSGLVPSTPPHHLQAALLAQHLALILER